MVSEEIIEKIDSVKEKILSPLKPKIHSKTEKQEKNKNQKQLIQKEIYFAS